MYIIRADGNAKIGAGHLMRCLTIAEALAEQLKGRQQIGFVCADEQSAAMASQAGFATWVLDTDYQDMESELPQWRHIMSELSGQVNEVAQEPVGHQILVDSYFVTDTYLEQLGAYGSVYLMDDMQEHAYPVDGVINYNAFAKDEIYQKLYGNSRTQCYVGSSYVPIREQFQNRNYFIREKVTDVLITTGGGDQDNIAGCMLQAIYRKDMEFHLVTGRFNPHLDELKRMEETCKGIHIYHDVSDMAGLMQKCDIAVTAGGTTIYELASIGVPFLCFSYAKNQEALTEYIGEKDIAGFLGAFHRDREAVLERLQKLFAAYCDSETLRKACLEKERNMIDGRGAKRLAEKLIQGRNGGRK